MGYVGMLPEYNADLWNLTARMTHTISLSQNKMHCSSKQQQHVSQWYATSILIWYLSDCITECHWTGGKVGCQIGKALCSGEAKQKGTVPATKQWWYDEKGVCDGTEVDELWCQWLLFHLDQGCIADYQKWDELAEERICGGNQESYHSW
jgi:hypothetical protein